jgi:hypothetical protein
VWGTHPAVRSERDAWDEAITELAATKPTTIAGLLELAMLIAGDAEHVEFEIGEGAEALPPLVGHLRDSIAALARHGDATALNEAA